MSEWQFYNEVAYMKSKYFDTLTLAIVYFTYIKTEKKHTLDIRNKNLKKSTKPVF